MQKLRVSDEVIVLAGKNKGKTGSLVNINYKKNTVIVKGVNLIKKAVKPTQENPNGGITEMEAALNISNIAIVSPKTKKATRIKVENKDGKNVRVAVACGSVLDK